MSTKPINIFNQTIARSLDLCKLHSQSPALNEKDDLIRAAITLAVAGFDAYFTDKFSDILIPYLKNHKPGPSLIKILQEAGLNAEAAIEIATMQRPFRRIRSIVQAHVSSKTTQRFHAIDELFICIGIKNLCKNAEKRTGYKALNTRIEAFVLKRHAIVHRADLNSRGGIQKIDAKRMERRINDLKTLVQACDHIIDSATTQAKRVAR